MITPKYTDQTLFIPGPTGQLEAIHSVPADQKPTACGLICHPHPQQEGTMYNKVVTTLHRAMQRMGWATVRFNYRGVMNSDGVYDQQIGEINDGIAVYDWLQEHHPHLPCHAAGFSFGAFIASQVATQRTTASLVTAAPVLNHSDYQQVSINVPWLVVAGDQDELINPNDLLTYQSSLMQPFQLSTFKETTHFFHGQLIPLRERVCEFYESLLT